MNPEQTNAPPVDQNYFFKVGQESIPEYNTRIEQYNASKRAAPPTPQPNPAPTTAQPAQPTGQDSQGNFTQDDAGVDAIQQKILAQKEAAVVDAQQFNDTITNIQNGSIPLNPDQNAMLEGLKQQFDQLINQQTLMNTSEVGGAQTRGYAKGAAENPLFQSNVVNTIAAAGFAKLGSLQTQKASAIGQMTAAFKSENIGAAKEAYDILTKARDEYDEELRTFAENIQKEIDKANEGIIEQAKIAAAEAKELTTAKTRILEDLGKSGNDVPPEVYDAIRNATDPMEAYIAAGDLLYGENDLLDAQYKRAQIAKITHDISMDSGGAFGGDASLAVAYANQYAATGQIPSGLPKGSFGLVAQIAKELPKSPGQIVSVSTGVTPTGDTSLQSGLGSLYSATELAHQLKELDEQRWSGIISGSIGKVIGSNEQRRYMDLRSQVIDLLSRARSGAALTPSEEERYGDMLPGRFSEPLGFGADSTVRIDNFINALESDIKNKASSQGWAVNGVSTVKIGGQTLKVGDIIVNGEGQTGRVNADGSVTLVQ